MHLSMGILLMWQRTFENHIVDGDVDGVVTDVGVVKDIYINYQVINFVYIKKK